MTVTTLWPTEPATADVLPSDARERSRRAASLRAQARKLDAVLANADRRRAAELELEAFIIALQHDEARSTGVA